MADPAFAGSGLLLAVWVAFAPGEPAMPALPSLPQQPRATSHTPAWLRALLRPGVRLMQLMRLQAKLALMAAAVLTPTLILMATQVDAELDTRNQVLQALRGVERHLQLAPLVSTAQRLRSLNHLVLAGDTRATPERDAVRTELKRAVEQADKALAAAPPAITSPWARVRTQLLALSDGVQPQGANQAF